MTPTLLVGMPGCGKSRLVRRIAEELRVPFCPMALAGMNDSMPFAGHGPGLVNRSGLAAHRCDAASSHARARLCCSTKSTR